MKAQMRPMLLVLLLLPLAGCESVENRWQDAQAENTVEAYEVFIEKNAKNAYADSARTRIVALRFHEADVHNTVEAFADFIDHFPTSPQATEAAKRHEGLLWARASDEGTPASYENYLRAYPDGSHGTGIRIEMTPGWFSEIVDCAKEMADIAAVESDETIYTVKSLSINGPQRNRRLSDETWAFLPNPESGPTIVSGTVRTTAGEITKDADLSSWEYVYQDSARTMYAGWAITVSSGDLILPTSVFENGPADRFVDNRFEIAAYCNERFIVHLDPEAGHKICLEMSQRGLPFFTLEYPGTVLRIGNRMFTRKSDGWYFSIDIDRRE